MTRLIDADAVYKEICRIYEYEYPTASGAFDEFVSKTLKNIIYNAPTVDAEKVVRCGLCVWFRKNCCIHPAQDMIPVLAMHFCDYGKRKDGE